MYRQSTGVDMNDFPVLGTPTSSDRGTPLLSRTSYASTAGTTPQQQQQFNSNDPSVANMSLFGNHDFMNNHQQQQQLNNLQHHQHSVFSPTSASGDFARKMNPKAFTVDEFPALKSNHNGSMSMKEEPWHDVAEGFNDSKQFGKMNMNMSSSQWAQGRNDLTQVQPQQIGQPSAAPLIPKSAVAADKSATEESDPYGLLGLLDVIRMVDPDRSMLALGSDLTTLGLELNTSEPIYPTFISPWSDSQTPPRVNIEPGYCVPSCYRNVKATPSTHERMSTFSDDILFYVFYCMPRDIAQEAAAQELYNRNWRYHKEFGLWLTKEADENGRPTQSFRRPIHSPDNSNAVDRGWYIFFDPTTWKKVKREWALSWDAIEDRSNNNGISNSSLVQPPNMSQ